MTKQGLSDWIRVPVLVARGPNAESNQIIVGITAALHGNEVNGVSCIHRVMKDLDISMLKGSVVAVPCLNIPGYLNFKREFRFHFNHLQHILRSVSFSATVYHL